MSFFSSFKKLVGINNVYDNHTTKEHFHVGLVRTLFGAQSLSLALALTNDIRRIDTDHCRIPHASLMTLTTVSLLWDQAKAG
jgi:hypothetical protein